MANYTMYYKDFVAKYGALEMLADIPDITIGETTFSFAEMFYARNKLKEICAETPELFREIANRYLVETALIFNKKIKDFEAHVDDVWQRELTAEERTTDNFYLNPTVAANSTSGNPKLQSTSEHVYPHHIVYNTKDGATLLAAAADIRNIYYDALIYTDALFMSIY